METVYLDRNGSIVRQRPQGLGCWAITVRDQTGLQCARINMPTPEDALRLADAAKALAAEMVAAQEAARKETR